MNRADTDRSGRGMVVGRAQFLAGLVGRGVPALLFVVALLPWAGCPEAGIDPGDTGVEIEVPDGFTADVATARTIEAAAGGSVEVPELGLTVVFPEGGGGTLTTAPLSGVPETPYPGGTRFALSFSGSEPVVIEVPGTPDHQTLLFLHGQGYGAVDGGPPREQAWHVQAAEPGEAGGSVRFALPRAAGLSSKHVRQAQGAGGTTVQGQTVTLPQTPADSTYASIAAQVDADIEAVLAALPDDMEQGIRKRVDANRSQLVVVPPTDGCAYSAFSSASVVTLIPRPILTFRENVERHKIAHEVGHYMNHMIAGDARYLPIQQSAPDANHGTADYRPFRTSITEEYAYFIEFLLLDKVNEYGDPLHNYRALIMNPKKPISPAEYDFPSIEGYGTVLMAQLTRTVDQMTGFDGAWIPVPPVGAAKGDVLRAYASGATTITELIGPLEDVVARAGYPGALPIFAEATGWSYRVTGRLVYAESGNPVSGAGVGPYIDSGGTRYTCGGATTNENGSFTIDRVYPGRSSYSVAIDGQTDTFTRDISWGERTTATFGWGNIAVNLDEPEEPLTRLEILRSAEAFQMEVWVPFTVHRDEPETNLHETFNTQMQLRFFANSIAWPTPTTFVAQYDRTVGSSRWDYSISGEFSEDGQTLTRCSAIETETRGGLSAGQRSVTVVNIPSNPADVTYRSASPAEVGQIAAFQYRGGTTMSAGIGDIRWGESGFPSIWFSPVPIHPPF